MALTINVGKPQIVLVPDDVTTPTSFQVTVTIATRIQGGNLIQREPFTYETTASNLSQTLADAYSALKTAIQNEFSTQQGGSPILVEDNSL